jgi:DNA-binding FadR family transcriptional regulator
MAVDEVLGSEQELRERYGVSRAVFRESVRLLEHQAVAQMRRGPGGGLVVTEPTVDVIIDAAVVYLHRVDATLDEVFDARIVLEQIVTDIAPARLNAHESARLRELIAEEAAGRNRDHRALHALLAAATKNAVLELFVEVLNRVTMLYMPDARVVGAATAAESGHAHARIADAVLDGNAALANRRMRKHLEAEADFLRRRKSVRQLLPKTVLTASPSRKRAEEVAHAILQAVEDGGLVPGHPLGAEPRLMQEHEVSRSVFREAVRLLEYHHIAVMRRGPGGGLFVASPDAGAVTDIVALHLTRRQVQVSELSDLRGRLELVLINLAVANVDERGAERLRTALAAEMNASDQEFAEAVHDLHAVIAGIAGNRALELVALVLIRLTRMHQLNVRTPRARQRIGDYVHKAHGDIVDAVLARDTKLAQTLMRNHLAELTAHLA